MRGKLGNEKPKTTSIDERVSWSSYIATGLCSMIACFLSAVQGDVGIFFRVRELLILVFRTDVQPLWVLVPAFLMGLCACWVERPQNSRSVLVAGLASFSLFGFAPYSKGVKSELKAMNRKMIAEYDLVIHPRSRYLDEHAETVTELAVILRSADFKIYQRSSIGLEGVALQVWEPGRYWLEIVGGDTYRNTVYPLEIREKVLELDIVLEKVSAGRGFWQKFWPAARGDRLGIS